MPQDGSTPDNRPTPKYPTQPEKQVENRGHVPSGANVVGRSMPQAPDVDASKTKGSVVAVAPPQAPSAAATPAESFAVDDPTQFAETSADDLMREVFSDVDRMLQAGVSIPPEPAREEAVELKPLSLSGLNLDTGGALAPRTSDDSASLDAAADSVLASPEPTADGSAPAGDRPSTMPEYSQSSIATMLLRLALVVSASVALGVGLAVWMAQRSQTQVATQAATSSSAPSTMNSPEADFINYMTESLDAIDSRYAQLDRFASADLDDDDNDVTVSTDAATPLPERVYIPVYQPPQTTAALPTLPAPPFSNVNLPAAPATAAPEATAESGNTSASVPNIAPDASHALVGLLELGDRSAAIFEYGGTAHRIEVGEQIGSSGWSLVSVSAQEAIIRRNGDVRSVYIGQSF